MSWRDGGVASRRTGSTVLSRLGSVLFGQLLLDMEKELVVGERRFRTILDQVLEETVLRRRVVSVQREKQNKELETSSLVVCSK